MHPAHAALVFLLGHVIRHGDGNAVPQAETHLAALNASIPEPETKPDAEPSK